MWLDQSPNLCPSLRVARLGLVTCVILLSLEDVWDVLFGFLLLANDPRVTVWTTCTLFKESANKNHVIRQPANHVVPWSQWIDAASHLPLIRVQGLLRHTIMDNLSFCSRACAGVCGVVLKVKGSPSIAAVPVMQS